MEGTPKAIELQGIRRNATKIGVQDGQAEDIKEYLNGGFAAFKESKHKPKGKRK